MAFCIFGVHLVAKGVLSNMGQIHPHFHMHIGKSANFFKIRVFHQTQAGFGVDRPHQTARDLQNTPRTPPARLTLGAASSQSALYEITNETTTAHCFVPMLTRPSDEAGPSP